MFSNNTESILQDMISVTFHEELKLIVNKYYEASTCIGKIKVSLKNLDVIFDPTLMSFQSTIFKFELIFSPEEGKFYNVFFNGGILKKQLFDYSTNLSEIKIKWEYISPFEGVVCIPIYRLSRYDLNLIDRKCVVEFPKQDSTRVIKVLSLLPCKSDSINQLLDENMQLSLTSPFSFNSDNANLTTCIIQENKEINVYLHINNIDGITTNVKNIDDPKNISLDIFYTTENLDKRPMHFNVKLIPISGIKAKGYISFRHKFHDEVGETIEDRSLMNKFNSPIFLYLDEQEESISSILIGSLIISNLETIPYKNIGINMTIDSLSLKAYCLDMELLSKKTTDAIPYMIKIPNGEDSQEIPIWLSYQKWKSLGKNAILSFQLKFFVSDIDNSKSKHFVRNFPIVINHTEPMDDRMKELMSEMDYRMFALSDQNANLKKELDKNKGEMQALIHQNANLIIELKRNRVEMQALSDQNANLKKELKRNRVEMQALIHQNENLKREVAENIGQMQVLIHQNDRLEYELAKNIDEIQELRNQNEKP